jgi:hypothetical protein
MNLNNMPIQASTVNLPRGSVSMEAKSSEARRLAQLDSLSGDFQRSSIPKSPELVEQDSETSPRREIEHSSPVLPGEYD